MKELAGAATPWHRSLWRIGTILQLREVLEYAEGVRSGATKSQGLGYVQSTILVDLSRDRGIEQGPLAQIVAVLSAGTNKTTGVLDRHVSRSFEQHIQRVDVDYLGTWRGDLLDNEVSPDDVELVARSIVSHLVDAGFSNDHLHQWLTSNASSGKSLDWFLADAERMKRRDYVDYEVVVPFTKCPDDIAAAAAERFISPSDLDQMTDAARIARTAQREVAGALTFHVTAREPAAAVQAAEAEVRRIVSRAVVGLPADRVVAHDKAFVRNANRVKWMTLRSRPRDIHVSSITRNGLLLPTRRSSDTSALDDAFELLAAVETSTSWASVAAIWAAVEGLLSEPSDTGADAADRMAAVVTCGFVRAELTQLSRHPTDNDDKRRAVETQALDALWLSINAGEDLDLRLPEHQAAVARIQAVGRDPHAVLDRVQRYFTDSFRSLFQQRNNLLHGGSFDSVSLPGTMRTVPPLVAAGVDRLVHASMTTPSTRPLSPAARAENELKLVGQLGGRPPHRMLD